MAFRLTISAQELDATGTALRGQLTDVRPALQRFAQYMRVQTDRTFQALRRGGDYRGVHWRYFAPQYTRKTDGVTVPAWGGVPKLRGQGLVLGRKRPSGARVKQGDAVVQDTMTLRGRAALVMGLTRNRLTLGPQGVRYAAAQQAKRPFLFFNFPADRDALAGMIRQHLEQ